ncbi:MAG: WXG100 family type VII secretion target, partial [Coriobacteriales bacterium]|nr:WXG100 family type VII secretion target [Coriobacteriales bacterium]
MGYEITIDLGKLETAISTYKEVISNLDAITKSLDNAMTSLESTGWRSPAGKAFFSKYDKGWKDNVKKRTKILAHLRDSLQTARTEYN